MKNLLTVLRVILSIPLLLLLLLAAFATPILLSFSKLTDADYISQVLSKTNIFEEVTDTLLSELKLEDVTSNNPGNDLEINEILEKVDVDTYFNEYTETMIGSLYSWLDGDVDEFKAEIDVEPLVKDIFQEMGGQLNDLQKDIDLPSCSKSQINKYLEASNTGNTEVLTNCKMDFTNIDYNDYWTTAVGKESSSESLKFTITFDDLDLSQKEANELKDSYQLVQKVGKLSVVVLIVLWVLTALMIPGLINGAKVSNSFVIFGAFVVFGLTFIFNTSLLSSLMGDSMTSASDELMINNLAELIAEFAKGIRNIALIVMGVPLLANIILIVSSKNKKKEEIDNKEINTSSNK